MSETIEERAKRICYRLDLAPTWNNGGEEAIELFDDLMAERGKMKERIEELEFYAETCEDAITEIYGGTIVDSPIVRNSITSLKVED